jgi:hypothetical protein
MKNLLKQIDEDMDKVTTWKESQDTLTNIMQDDE